MQGWWQDTGTIEGMLSANAQLLDGIALEIHPSARLTQVKMQGRVRIGPDVELRNVRLRGPLVIGPGSRLADAYVGPYTSVGDGTHMERVAVENSILLPGCRLLGPALRLEDSLVGSGAAIWSREGRSVSLLVGDDSHLLIPPDRR
jgi:glucose-1-phosphate thymidylyltransferase